MSTEQSSADEERSGYDWLAQEVTPSGGTEGYHQLKQLQRNREVVAHRKKAAWQKWVTRTVIVITGALLGLVVDAALTDHWDRFYQRILVLLIVGVPPSAVIYWKMIQHHAEKVILSSMISRQIELTMLRHDPAIKAARWAFFIALPAATFGAAAKSHDQIIGYGAAIGCEVFLLAAFLAWQSAHRSKEQMPD